MIAPQINLSSIWLLVVCIASISINARAQPSLGEAVDMPGLVWGSTISTPWTGQQTVSHDGSDAAKSPALSANGLSQLWTDVTGPGTLRFWWKLEGNNFTHAITFVTNDPQAATFTDWTATGWQEHVVQLPAKTVRLYWEFRSLSGSTAADAAFLDQVNFTPGGDSSLADALDAPDLPWSTSTTNPWTRVTSENHDGIDSARAGPITSTSFTFADIDTMVTGPGVLRYWWKASSDPGLSLRVDGYATREISGEIDWREETILVEPGAHNLSYRYFKNISLTPAQDLGWLDSVSYTPIAFSSLDQAVDLVSSEISLTSGGGASWRGQPLITHDGQDAAQSGLVAYDQESWMEATVDGAGTISWWWKGDFAAYRAEAQVWVDGKLIDKELTGFDWASRTLSLPKHVRHTVRWVWLNLTSETVGHAPALFLDQFGWQARPQPLLTEGTEHAQPWWTGLEDTGWYRTTADSHDGVDSVRTTASQQPLHENWMRTTVTGPCELKFWWKNTGGADDALTVLVDGEPMDALPGAAPWTPRNLYISTGPHEVSWVYKKGTVAGTGDEAGWLDQVTTVAAAPEPTLQPPGFVSPTPLNGVITQGGEVGWIQVPGPWDGGPEGAPGALGSLPMEYIPQNPDQHHENWLEIYVEGPKFVTFRLYLGPTNHHWDVTVDGSNGTPIYGIPGDVGQTISLRSVGGPLIWPHLGMFIPPGTHRLRFTHYADGPSSLPPLFDAAISTIMQTRVVPTYEPVSGSAGRELALGADGNFYAANGGTFFRFTPSGWLTTLPNPDADDPYEPRPATSSNSFTRGQDGALYAPTNGGLLRLAQDGTHTLAGTADLGRSGGLSLSPSGNLVGTLHDSANQIGPDSVYQITPQGVVTTILEDLAPGVFPFAPVSFAIDGSIFGTCVNGGAGTGGTFFRFSPMGGSWMLADNIAFPGTTAITGRNSVYPLCQGQDGSGRDGWFYGLTQGGGALDPPSVFRVSPEGSLEFVTRGLIAPTSGLAQGPDGRLYGANYHRFYQLTDFRLAIPFTTEIQETTEGYHNYTPVMGRDGNLYVNGALFYRMRFGPTPELLPPTTTTTSAYLRGRVSTNSQLTHWQLRAGPTPAQMPVVADLLIADQTTPYEFSALVTGYSPSAAIYYQLEASNYSGTQTTPIRCVNTKIGLGIPTVPEIAVEQPAGTALSSGDSTIPFGTTDINGPGVAKTFTIRNSGTDDLIGLDISVAGVSAADFTVSSFPGTPVVPGSSTIFTVDFAPRNLGVRSATIEIASNDVDENPFTIALNGTGTGTIMAPQIVVEHPMGTILVPGTASVSFGTVVLGASSTAKTFKIRNTGNAPLAISGLDVTAGNTGEFTVNSSGMLFSLPVNGETTFSATFTPGRSGSRASVLRIVSNDPDENPFDVELTGTAQAFSSDANLSNLVLSAGTLSPAFASGTTSYTDAVPFGTSSVTVTPTKADANASIKVNGTTVTSGAASAPISLAIGSNTITTAVTAEDAMTQKTYTITVTRANAVPGNLDLAFGSGGVATDGGDFTTSGMAIQNDGKILVIGESTTALQPSFWLRRFKPDGSVDTAFGTNGSVITPIGAGASHAKSVAVLPDLRIVVAGDALNGTDTDFALVRYFPDGSPDPSFGTSLNGIVMTPISGDDTASSMVVMSSGKIVVTGTCVGVHNVTVGTNTIPIQSPDVAAVRYNANGTLDSTFDTDGKVTTDFTYLTPSVPVPWYEEGHSVAVQSDGKIVVAAQTYGGGSFHGVLLLRYNDNGSLDPTFNGSGYFGPVNFGNILTARVAVQSDQKIVVASINGSPGDFSMMRLTSTGVPDTTFNGSGFTGAAVGAGDDRVQSLALQSDGKILVAGYAFNGANYDFALARFGANGALDPTFNGTGTVITPIGSLNDYGRSVAIQIDGNIVVAGDSVYNTTTVHSQVAMVKYIGQGLGFANASGITIPSSGNATPYPSTIAVSGVSGPVSSLQVRINGLTHTYLDDVDIFLMAPNGAVAAVMSDAGGSSTVVGANLVFDDAGANAIPDSTPITGITSGTYRPADYQIGEALPPGGIGTIGTNLTALTTGGINGDWKLFVSDDVNGNSGSITSWSLVFSPSAGDTDGPAAGTMTLTPASPVDPSAALTAAFANWTDATLPLTYQVLIDGVIVSAQGSSSSRNFTGPATPGTHTLTGRIYDSLNNMTEATRTFSVNGTTPQQSWRQIYFGSTSNTGNAADSFDYDKDGLVNLLEWACGLNPTTASALPITTIRNGTNIEFTYTRSVSALNAGAAFIVEWSDDLPGISWSVAGVTQTILSDNATVQQVKATVPAGSSSHRFVHLKVTGP